MVEMHVFMDSILSSISSFKSRKYCSTWCVSSVHGQAGERHRSQAELAVGEAAGGRRQDAGVLRGVQSRHRDGTDHRCNTREQRKQSVKQPTRSKYTTLALVFQTRHSDVQQAKSLDLSGTPAISYS